jgi:hypothetical protein
MNCEMANRVIRDWTASESVDLLSIEAEIFFTRLIMKADDYGNYVGNPRLLNAALFPLKEYETGQIISWARECEKAGLIIRYTNSGKDYINIPNFGQTLRRMKAVYPSPTVDGSLRTSDGQTRTDYGQVTAERKGKEIESETETKEKTLEWFVNQIDEIYLENLKYTHKGKNIEQAVKEAYAHVASDSLRLKNLDGASAKKLLNTWLANTKIQSNGKSKGLDVKSEIQSIYNRNQ